MIYLTINDLFNQNYNWRDVTSSTPNFKTFYEVANNNFDETCFYQNNQYLDKVLKRLVNRWNNTQAILAVVEEGYDKTEVQKRFINKVLLKFQMTQDYYVEAIKRYESYLSDSKTLSNTSTTTTRFNDTPNSEGEYVGTNYTNNITETSTTTPIDKVDRYIQFRTLINNLYSDWVDEFKVFEYFTGDR